MKIVRVVQTCEAAPSQWDAWTDTDQYLYLRYRHGRGRVETYDSADYRTWPDFGTPEYEAAKVTVFEWCNCNEHFGCHRTGIPGRPCYAGWITLEHFCQLAGMQLELQ